MIKNYKLVVALIVIVVVICSLTIFFSLNPHKDLGISAIEGRIKADEIAKNWDSSAELVDVGLMTSIGGTNDGIAKAWGYSYICNNSSVGFAVTIFSNGSYISSELEPPSPNPILNWTIDSDDAIQIAKSNPEIKQWLDKYNNANLQSMVLTANSNGTAWGIAWNDPGFMDDPHTAVIGIDANSGEVIDVYVQM